MFSFQQYVYVELNVKFISILNFQFENTVRVRKILKGT